MKKITNTSEQLAFLLACFLIIIAPLLYSGKGAYTKMLLESTGLALLGLSLLALPVFERVYKPIQLFLITSLALTSLYLLPIPESMWNTLPGRDFYHPVISWLQQQQVEPRLYFSLIPTESMFALLSLLAPLAIFLFTTSSSQARFKNLITVFLCLAAFEAALGLIQYASENPAFYFGIPPNGKSAQGTYVNRDHFAALMEMALPLTIALTLYTLGRKELHQHDASWVKLHETLIFGSLMLLILLAGIFTRSRTGVFLVLVGVLLSSIAFARHIGGRQSVGITTIFATIAIGTASSIGLIPVLNRFVGKDPLEDERWRIAQHTIEGIKSFFPLGSGPGTFPDVYRAFQPVEQMRFINNAHNDYLELLFDMGAAGVFIIVSFFLLYIYGWVKLWGKKWDRLHFLQIAAGISIFLILLHSFTDFNLHTPANMIVFALMCGIFFRKAEGEKHLSRKKTLPVSG